MASTFAPLAAKRFCVTSSRISRRKVPQFARIVNGYEDGSFRPNQLLTRQEFFKLIENFCTAAAFSPTAADGALNGFADANKISSWAKESAQICVSYSYVQGTKLGNGTYLLHLRRKLQRARHERKA